MSEKPQEVQADQEDLLEQIITQGLNKVNAPERTNEEAPAAETPPAPNAPEQGDSGEASPPGDRKHRRSSVYLYLLVLFGAAFLMLLLAYFVQQRSNETTISDLRESMNLSREELLEQIGALEEENAGLTEDNEALIEWNKQLSGDLTQLQDRYNEQVQDANGLYEQLYAAREDLYSWKSFWDLERCYQAGDYESCAAIMILQSQSQYTYRTPDAVRERQEEIIQAVIDTGILDDRSQEHYDELLDAYLAEHTVNLLPAGC